MPLVVPFLRFFVVFLNIYETFKTLKPPPPSARRVGKPSTRALTQRKRDLKGCLAVWVVWCCYAAYERTFDPAVGIFLPFYSEFKSAFLLFLVLTRAKGAEPLFLHVLRPLVKPYATVLDPILDLLRDLGDFFSALLQVPLDYILSSSWFPFWRSPESEQTVPEASSDDSIRSTHSENLTRTSSQSNVPIFADGGVAAQPSRVQTAGQATLRSVSDHQRTDGRSSQNNTNDSRIPQRRHSVSASTASLPAYSEYPSQEPPQYSRTISRHQVWYPIVSASPSSGQGLPISTLNEFGTAPEYRSPEWRTYPAFPSAYPPTPLPASVSLPSPSAASLGSDHRLVSHCAYPPIPENEQGFSGILEGQHGKYPGFVPDSSKLRRGNRARESFDPSRQSDEDVSLGGSLYSSEAGLSEEDLGTSLRTPYRPPEAIPPSAYSSSVDSLTSAPAAGNNAPSLRAKTSSDSLSSGASSLAGRKRTHGTSYEKTLGTMSQSRNATLRGRPASSSIPQGLMQSSSSEDEHEVEVGDSDNNAKAKKRRVLDPLKRRSTVRLTAREAGGGRKALLPSRGMNTRGRAATTVSQAVARTRIGAGTTDSSTIKGKKSTRPVARGGPQGVVKTASTSSSRSGTLRGRVQ